MTSTTTERGTDSPAAGEVDDGSRCIRTGRPTGDPHLLIGGRIRPPRDPVAIEAVMLFEKQLRRPTLRQWARAMLGGVVVSAIGTALWYAVRGWGDVPAAVVAVVIGVALGAVVVVASGGRHGWQLATISVGLTIVSMVLSANFLQRDQLQTGIETLEPRWAAMRSMADAVDETGAETDGEADAPAPTPTPDDSGTADADTEEPVAETSPPVIGGSGSDDLIPDDAALAADTVVGGILVPAGSVIPPPEIVQVMPTAAFELMGPEVMAVVWLDIPDEVKAEFDPALVGEVEALIVASEAATADAGADADASGALTLEQARSIYAESSYDIPQPVLECAPPPDLTQPDAAAGLGFPDGVPLLLPLSDYYRTRERGDGLDVAAPTPWCFASENAKSEPIEAASWLIGLAAAAAIPARRRLAVVRNGKRSRTHYEQITGEG